MAKGRRNDTVRLLGVVRRARPALMMSTALQATVSLVLALPAHGQPAPNARPTGGVVVGGSASISQTANSTAINQASQRAAVNWQSFNVGSQQSVNFNQPSASAVTLNRVVGPDPSQIAGRINANGQVVLINQSGVTFFKGAQVNTNGLMVSAIGMSNKAVQGFMATGKVVLDQPGNPNAAVINDGNITVKQAGLAALVAPQVANHGTITAELGHVVLAGAKTATLDLYGDGLLSLDVTNQVTQVPVGKDGKPVSALVTNTGVIIADGGTVQLTARAADGIVQNLVDAGGRIRASTMGEHTGTIALNGMGGSIIVEGQLSATGRQPGTTGGAIEVATDQNVVVASTAKINASGKAGGGTVAIGTTLARARGGPSVTPTLTAKNVVVASGATIKADAIQRGDGGRVTILSAGTTTVNATITAKGGPAAGIGGFVETSGPVLGVGTDAVVNVGALSSSGQSGTWLLDPFDIAITGADSNTSQSSGTFTASADPATIANTTLQSALASGNVIISTAGSGKADQGNITVSSGVTWTSANSLTLDADNNILINAAISATKGGLVLNAGTTTATGSITISASVAAQSFAASTGASGIINLNFSTAPVVATSGGGQTYNSPVVLQADASVTDTGNGPIAFASKMDGGFGLTVNAGTGAVTFGAPVGSANPLASLVVTGPTTLTGNVTTTGTQTFNNAVTLAAPTTLATTNAAIQLLGKVAGGANSLQLSSGSGNQTLSGITTSGNLTLTTTGVVTLDSGTYTITGGASPFVFPAVTTNGVLTLGQATSFGAVTLGSNTTFDSSAVNGAIDFTNTVDGTAAGAQSLTANAGTGAVTFGAAVGGNKSLSSLAVTGPTTLSGNVTTSGGGQNYGGAVVLQSNASVTDNGNGAIDFTSTVDGAAAGTQSLTVNAGTGAVTFGAAVGGNKSLSSLAVTGPTTLTGNVTTTGTQTFNNAVTLAAPTTLATTNAAIQLLGQVTGGSNSLTLSSGSGNQTLSGITTSGNLTLISTGVVTLDGGIYTITGGGSPFVFPAVTTNGVLTLGQATSFGAVTLGSSTTFDSSAVNGAIDFTSTVNGTTAGAQSLTANAGTGAVTFGAAVGGNKSLSSLAVTGPTTLTGNVTTTGTQTFNSAVTLAAPTTLATTNAAIQLLGQMTGGANSLTLSSGSGNQTLSGITTSGNLTLTTTGVVTLDSGIYTITGGGSPFVFPAVTTNGVLTLGQATSFGAVTLGSSTTFDSSAVNGAIDFTSTVDGTAAGAQSLTANAGTGAVTFGAAVGGNKSLSSLAVTGPTTLSGNVTTSGGGQTYNGAVILQGNAALSDSGNGAIDFAKTVDGATAGAQSLTVNAGTGTVTFGAAVGGNKSLSSLAVTGPTTLTGNVTTTGTQTFNNAVTLAAPTTLATTNAAIQLLGQVAGGANSLQLSSGSGNQTLSGITTSGNLTLITTGVVTLDSGIYTITGGGSPFVFPAVTTNGVLTLGQATSFGAVTLGSNTTFDSSAVNGAIDFASTVNGAFGLTANAGSATLTFGSTVGGTSAPTNVVATAGSIVIAGAISAGALTLDSTGTGNTLALNTTISTGALSLISAGAITEAGIIKATSLTGSAVGPVGLVGNNVIGSVGTFAVTGPGSSFNLTEATDQNLSVTGPLTASQDVVLNTGGTGGLTVTGSIGAGHALAANAGTGGIQLSTGALLNAGTVDLDTTGGGVTESGNGLINATTLLSSTGVTNTVTLGNANTISTIAGFTVTGGDFDLNDTGAATLTVTGPLQATNVAINGASTLNVLGSIGATGTGSLAAGTIALGTNAHVTGATVDLAASAGGIALTNNASLGQAGGIVDLSATGTGISEAATATITAATLQSAGGVGGSVDLPSASNAIGGVGNFAVTGGANHFAMLDTAPLTVSGVLSAPGQVYLQDSSTTGIAVTGKVSAGGLASFQTGALSNTGTISGTAMEWAPNSGILTITGPGGVIPTNVVIGAVTVPGGTQTTTASALVVGSNFGNSATVLDLQSLGGITESGGAALTAASLTGIAGGDVLLTNSNAITTLAGFTDTGFNFSLNNTGLLGVSSTVVGNSVTISDNNALTINGTVTAASVGLSAPSVSIPGLVNGGQVQLSGGTVTEAGTLIATTLTGNMSGAATLIGAGATINQVQTISSFTANGFTLDNGLALAITGALSGGSGATILDSGDISVAAGGAVSAGAISLTGANITIAGTSNDGGAAGTTSLVATNGTVGVSGALTSGTLSGSATTSASLLGTAPTTNQVTTLAGFSAPGGFTLDDGTALTVTGTLAGGPTATILDKGALAINGTVTATAVSLTADSITIPGKVAGNSVGLFGTVGAIDETGEIDAATLIGSAVTSATLAGASATTNQINALDGFTTSTGFTLHDGVDLTVTKTLSGGPTATILDSGALAISGTVTATAVSLTADSITIPGKVTGNSVGLFGTVGAISENGEIDAVTLNGSAVTSAALTGATATTNQIGTITSFTAGSGFSLNDGQALTVANTVSGGSSAAIVDAGALAINGTVTATSVGLTADSITIPGLVNGGAVTLFGTLGAINETGTLIAGTLTGSAATSASFTGTAPTTNQIGIVGGFTTTAGFTLRDGIALAANNTLSGGTGATITDSGALTINGAVSATSVGLTADSITIPGLVSGSSVTLTSTVGGISESGTILAGIFSGSAIAGISLTGATPTTNQISTVSNMSAGSGITLDDGIALTVTGLVGGGPTTTILDKGALAINGAVTGTTISLTGDSISIPGVVNGSAVSLAGTAGAISETGTIIATTLAGSAATSASLTGATPTTNQIGTLNDFTTSSGFLLDDGTPLTVAGTLSGGPAATIVDTGALTINGSVIAAAVSLAGGSISIPGLVNGSSTVSLFGTVGAISETGTLIAGTLSGSAATGVSLTGAAAGTNQITALNGFTAPSGFNLDDGIGLTVTSTIAGGPSVTILDNGQLAINGAVTATNIGLTANAIGIAGNISGNAVSLASTTGGISETGVLNAASLSGSAATSANFAGTNQISTLNGFSAAGGFSLTDGIALSVFGTVSGGPSAAIADSNALTVNGTVSATSVALSGSNVTIPGSIAATNAASIASSGTISETGAMSVGTLSGSSAGAAAFTGNNAIASLSNFTANGLTLIDNSNLGIIGAVQAGPAATITSGGSIDVTGLLVANVISLHANSGILIPGTVQDADSVSLVTNNGSITETGLLIASLLTGSAPGDIDLTGNGANQVADLGSITSGGTFTLGDAINLTIDGPISAPKIVINDPNANVTLANGAVIATGGTTRPSGTVTNFPSSTTSSAGAFLQVANFFQLGSSTVIGYGNPSAPNILRIDALGNGNITFSTTGGLTGNSTWLILDIGTGQATGSIFVRSLDINRAGTSGSTNLVGTINGVAGSAAAGVANIGPIASSAFRFNACPIHSVNCVLLPTLGLPVANPLNDIYLGSIYNPDDNDDLLLPIVSDQDY